MGEYADIAIDDSLDPAWDEDGDGDDGWMGRRPRRKKRANQKVFRQFKDYEPSPEEVGF